MRWSNANGFKAERWSFLILLWKRLPGLGNNLTQPAALVSIEQAIIFHDFHQQVLQGLTTGTGDVDYADDRRCNHFLINRLLPEFDNFCGVRWNRIIHDCEGRNLLNGF